MVEQSLCMYYLTYSTYLNVMERKKENKFKAIKNHTVLEVSISIIIA